MKVVFISIVGMLEVCSIVKLVCLMFGLWFLLICFNLFSMCLVVFLEVFM